LVGMLGGELPVSFEFDEGLSRVVVLFLSIIKPFVLNYVSTFKPCGVDHVVAVSRINDRAVRWKVAEAFQKSGLRGRVKIGCRLV
jgi:hypothetical protein